MRSSGMHLIPSFFYFLNSFFVMLGETANFETGCKKFTWQGTETAETKRKIVTHRLTVTLKKVAGMEVVLVLLLLFWLLNKTSNSFCNSKALPFFSAASNAFIVGP